MTPDSLSFAAAYLACHCLPKRSPCHLKGRGWLSPPLQTIAACLSVQVQDHACLPPVGSASKVGLTVRCAAFTSDFIHKRSPPKTGSALGIRGCARWDPAAGSTSRRPPRFCRMRSAFCPDLCVSVFTLTRTMLGDTDCSVFSGDLLFHLMC